MESGLEGRLQPQLFGSCGECEECGIPVICKILHQKFSRLGSVLRTPIFGGAMLSGPVAKGPGRPQALL